MPGIVCAIRGGPYSQSTINKAISIGQVENTSIYFLYVINFDFLTHTQTSRVSILSKEMQEMGEFILLSAQAEAEEKGVNSVGITRKGNIEDAIINVCKEFDAGYVILGRPKVSEGENVFDFSRLEVLKERIEKDGDAKVIFAEKED